MHRSNGIFTNILRIYNIIVIVCVCFCISVLKRTAEFVCIIEYIRITKTILYEPRKAISYKTIFYRKLNIDSLSVK